MSSDYQVPGFSTATQACGMKKNNALDLCVIVSEKPAVAGGVFTRNRIVGEPVKLDRRHLRHPTHRAVVINARYANVCTGKQGYQDAKSMAQEVALCLECDPREVLVSSTGIIGAALPTDKILPGIRSALAHPNSLGWGEAAQAIMTTDTRPKQVFRQIDIQGKPVSLMGIAKGSGMIEPNMATMLAYIVTDAAVEKNWWQKAVAQAAEESFNRVTVDGDTSTSDTFIALANGLAGHSPINKDDKDGQMLKTVLGEMTVELAREIARDGEGAQHLITVEVEGAGNDRKALQIARSIANSPLVKTAVAGRDANWGRLAMAAGKAGVAFNPRHLGIEINGFPLMEKGQPLAFDEAALTESLSREEVHFGVKVGPGRGLGRVWTCDLTHDYIRINGEYRT